MSWICKHEGTKDEQMGPIENFGSECVVCGKPQGGADSEDGGLPPWLLPLLAAGLGLVLVLGGGYLLSPSIPGVCSVLKNCKSWETDSEKAIQQGDSAVSQLEGADPTALSGLKTDLQDAIDTLKGIPASAKNSSQVAAKRDAYQAELDTLTSFETAISKADGALNQIDKADLDKIPDLQKELVAAIEALKAIPDTAKISKLSQTKQAEYQAEVDHLVTFDKAIKQGDKAVEDLDGADPADLPRLKQDLEEAIERLEGVAKTAKIYNKAVETSKKYKETLSKIPPTPTPTPTPAPQPDPEPYRPPAPQPDPEPYRPPAPQPDPEPYIPTVPSETQKPIPGL